MKIVSYNISDSYPWKIERLLKMQADVLVVPEITCPEDAHLPDDYEMCWKGISYFFQFRRWKGLGILWRKGLGYIPDWYNPNHFYAIPLIIGDILGIGLVLMQQLTGVVSLDPQTYYVSEAPVELNIPIVIVLNLATLFISISVLIIPSFFISHIHPAKSMRYE